MKTMLILLAVAIAVTMIFLLLANRPRRQQELREWSAYEQRMKRMQDEMSRQAANIRAGRHPGDDGPGLLQSIMTRYGMSVPTGLSDEQVGELERQLWKTHQMNWTGGHHG